MFDRIRTRLFFSHLGVALVSILVITWMANLVSAYSLSNYLHEQLRMELNGMAKQLETDYGTAEGWSESTLMGLSHEAMIRGMTVRIYDNANRLVWNSADMTENGTGTGTAGDELETSAELIVKGERKGTLSLSYSRNLLEQQSRSFLNLFNLLTWASVAVVLVGVFFFSRYLAGGLSKPLLQIKRAATLMRNGDLSQRVDAIRGNGEIAEVGIALNHLADTLQKQDRLRKNLTQDLAHELRTPLTTIRSYIEAFQDGVWEPSQEHLETCHAQVMQLIELIQDLERLTDAENPMIKLDKKSCRVDRLLEAAVAAVRPAWSDKDIRLETQIESSLALWGDERRMEQVMMNLLSNAYKYTPEHGTITIKTWEDRKFTHLSIANSGKGIPEDDLPYLFERFYRGDKSRNRKVGGAGLGLAIVKTIVEAHGGTIQATRPPGEGALFTLRLPKGNDELQENFTFPS